ncbi:hypothetical protein [Candidatus Poriferisocius sp.]|uniref:8-oxoguanine DNA glycosylase n=1 Tax=Candidatus Poriferisocius sp. TaxID=3101276 RepID=UPI003B02CA8F
MAGAASLEPVRDLHCGRSSHDRIGFTVRDQSWDVEWGSHEVFGTPAFWANRTAAERYEERLAERALAADIESVVVFCLLGGSGIRAESAQAARQVVLDLLAENHDATAGEIEERLREPLPGGLGSYRFPVQRSEYIAASLARLRSEPPPEDPLELNAYLKGLRGVGPLKAAHVVRNLTGSAEVAIVSALLVRVLTWAGIFRPGWSAQRHYTRCEDAFLQYAEHGNVQPGALDLCIWEKARNVEPSYFSLGKPK